MAHQCLKCGRSYPDGSQEILKGCADCKGTRFFYAERPLGEDDREALAAQAERDLEGDAGTRTRGIPTKDELPIGEGRDWVAIGPNHLRGIVEDVVKRAHERKPQFRVGGKEPTKSLAEWVRERESESSAGEPDEPQGESLSIVLDEPAPAVRHPWPDATPPRRAAARAAPPAREDADPDRVVYKRTRPLKPLGLAGEAVDADDEAAMREAARQAVPAAAERVEADAPQGGEDASLYPEGERPETVAVLEQGVYDLDVKRLMERSPIVIHKDGTYNLHLPSLLESLGSRKK